MAETNRTNPKATNMGKMKLIDTGIIGLKDIKPTYMNKTIEARVYRKWTARNASTKEPSSFCCMLIDKEEDETIDTFTKKLTTLVNKAASLGYTMEDETLVRKLLNAVPDRRVPHEVQKLQRVQILQRMQKTAGSAENSKN
nr:zinc finger, CCHC-type [Tanacetum cinerariifolium]